MPVLRSRIILMKPEQKRNAAAAPAPTMVFNLNRLKKTAQFLYVYN
jgi:hypothetical protein